MRSVRLLPYFLILSILFSVPAFSQEENNENDSAVSYKGAEGFHLGFYLGAFFPNKSSAQIYDGIGYDANGNKYDFANSFIYRRIVLENDPNTGNVDRIATAVGVNNHDDWKFDETDVPVNLKYNTAFLFGLALNYGLNKQQSIIGNFNFAQLRVIGNFTIETRNSTNQQLTTDFINNQFAIAGSEQRLMIQLGYCRILGQNEKGNFFIEGGLCINNAKFVKNFVQINSLEIDLTTFDQNTVGGTSIYSEHYTGWGFGAFAGVGLNLTMNPKYTIQFLYTPSYETINLGPNPTTALQNAAGLRAYYNF